MQALKEEAEKGVERVLEIEGKALESMIIKMHPQLKAAADTSIQCFENIISSEQDPIKKLQLQATLDVVKLILETFFKL